MGGKALASEPNCCCGMGAEASKRPPVIHEFDDTHPTVFRSDAPQTICCPISTGPQGGSLPGSKLCVSASELELCKIDTHRAYQPAVVPLSNSTVPAPVSSVAIMEDARGSDSQKRHTTIGISRRPDQDADDAGDARGGGHNAAERNEAARGRQAARDRLAYRAAKAREGSRRRQPGGPIGMERCPVPMAAAVPSLVADIAVALGGQNNMDKQQWMTSDVNVSNGPSKCRVALIADELESAMQWKQRCQDTPDLCTCSVLSAQAEPLQAALEMQQQNPSCSEVRTKEQKLAAHKSSLRSKRKAGTKMSWRTRNERRQRRG